MTNNISSPAQTNFADDNIRFHKLFEDVNAVGLGLTRVLFADDNGWREVRTSRTDGEAKPIHSGSVDTADPLFQSVMDYKEWSERTTTPVLERNECSRLHALAEAFISNDIAFRYPAQAIAIQHALSETISHPFVVKQDWARAFQHAAGMDDVFRLPFETCVFEFRVSGRSVNVIAIEAGEEIRLTAMVKGVGDCWVCVNDFKESEKGLMRFLRGQIKAACYALDSEVATQSIIQAPRKLNAKRQRTGKVLLRDYHVVDLANRRRGAHSSSKGRDYAGSVRLHFRRGHWRHLEEKTIWIKPCLVGNPDLDWVANEYSL